MSRASYILICTLIEIYPPPTYTHQTARYSFLFLITVFLNQFQVPTNCIVGGEVHFYNHNFT